MEHPTQATKRPKTHAVPTDNLCTAWVTQVISQSLGGDFPQTAKDFIEVGSDYWYTDMKCLDPAKGVDADARQKLLSQFAEWRESN